MSLSLTVAMVHYGYGKTKFLLDHAQMTTALKYSNFAVLVNGFAMAFLWLALMAERPLRSGSATPTRPAAG